MTWYEGIVRDIAEIAPNVRQFRVEIPALAEFSYEAGQFVTFDLPIGDKRLQRWRSYSIANAPDGTNAFELCIVRSASGAGSRYFFEDVAVGTALKFKGPDGNFCLPDTVGKDLVLICTGTGIAPFRAMLQDLLGKRRHPGRVHLIFGTRFASGLLYRAEMAAFAKEFPNFTYDFALSRDEAAEGGLKGYVHGIYMEAYREKRPDVTFFLCGWSSMIDDAVANLIVTCGYERGQVLYELYG
jgi:ferredoxin-NADP reductase